MSTPQTIEAETSWSVYAETGLIEIDTEQGTLVLHVAESEWASFVGALRRQLDEADGEA